MALAASPVGTVYRFDRFELDELALTFKASGTLTPLPIKPWSTLLLLAQSAPDTVSKAELMDTVWLSRVVTEGVLTQVISRLRVVLGDQNQDIIKTVHGVGFRLALPVTRANPNRGDARSTLNDAPSFELGTDTALRGRPLWRLTQALSTSKRTAVWLGVRRNDQLQRVFKFAHDGAGLRALKRELSVTRVLQAAQTASGICAVIDANFSEAPFFIELPYFNGGDLVDFYDAHAGISIEHRLAILISIARALADCHAVGIIHGDIKPKNILLTMHDDEKPEAHLADFGAALLLDPERLKALELSAIHQTGLIMADPGGGTLAYAAPELLAGKSATTASDAYAFGVTAFQLLCGEFSRPLSPGWDELIANPLLRQDIADMCHADPAKRPNLSEIAERLVSLDRRTEAAIVSQQAAAEYESVKATAVKREQERALDLARIDYLTRRRRLLHWVAASLVALLALASTGFIVAREQTLLAEHSAKEAQRYQKRAEIVQQTLFSEMVISVNPYEQGSVDAKVVDSLERIADSIVEKLASEPVFAAQMLEMLSASLTVTGRQARGEQGLRTALRLVADKDPILASSICNRLADGLRLQGKQVEALSFYRRGFEHAAGLTKARSALGIADIRNQQGFPNEALTYLEIADQVIAGAPDVQPTVRIAAWSLRGKVLAQQGELDQAQAQFKKVIDFAAQVKMGNPVQSGLRGLAKVSFLRGDVAGAVQQQRVAIEKIDKQMPASRPANNARLELAQFYVASKDFTAAKSLLDTLLNPKSGIPALELDFKVLAQIEMAKVLLHFEKPAQAVILLNQAKPEIVIALSKDSVLYREFEALKSATNR